MKKNKQILLISMLFLVSCSSGVSSSIANNTSHNSNGTTTSSIVTSSVGNSISTTSSEASASKSESESSQSSKDTNSNTSSQNVTSSENSSAVSKYKINVTENPNVTFSLVGLKDEFEKGEEVSFSYSPKYGFKVTSFSIKDSNLNDIAYTQTSYVTFLMPESDVTISFVTEVRKTLEIVNGEHSTINVTDKEDYYDAGAKINFTVNVENGYELDTLKVLKEENGSYVEVEYVFENEVYSFDFVDANMKIEVTDKAKVVSNDPFTAPTTYEGDWDYYDGYYDYIMRLRIVFNGDYTLSWYLTWEDLPYEYYSYSNAFNHKMNAKPSDMVGTIRDSQENISYEYNETTDTIFFVTPLKMSTKECTLVLTRNESKEITSVMMTENMSDGYYQTGNRTLSKK